MNIDNFQLNYEELLSEAFRLPNGRSLWASLEIQTYVAAGPEPVQADTLALAVEIRRTRDGDFEELGRTPALTSGQRAKIEIPPILSGEETDATAYPGVIRLRLVHEGRFRPSCRVSVDGL